MSVLSFAFPVQLAVPAAEALGTTALAAARPLLGFGAVAAFFVVFKPLLLGLLRAALLVVQPRTSQEDRSAQARVESARMLNHMARELDLNQPGLAAELRNLAAHR